MFVQRVSIPSCEGEFVKDLDDEALTIHLGDQHGRNTETVKLSILGWLALLADSPLGLKPNRVINRFINNLTGDFRDQVRVLSSLSDRLLNSLEIGSDRTPVIPEFLSDFRDTPVFREYHVFTKTGDPQLLRFLLSFLTFAKKVSYEDPSLEPVALRAWLQIEEDMKNRTLPMFVDGIALVTRWLFADWEEGPFLPKFGSGSVSERGVRGVNLKGESFTLHRKLHYMYVREKSLADSDAYLAVTPDGCDLPEPGIVHSRLKFVPKDHKSVRSICMEPNGFMWAQQAVRLWFEKHLRTSILRRHIDIQDQSRNRLAARLGSYSNMLDTIDLSSASDCVSWDLVKKIFPAGVLKHLLATRTKTVELPDGNDYVVSKFAPMGSALCFPTQCAVYASVILYVSFCMKLGRDWRQPGSLDDVSSFDDLYYQTFERDYSFWRTGRFLPFSVYGDDMVTDYETTSNVMDALQDLGFIVNRSKSFLAQKAIRESCGGYYYRGREITPLRCKFGVSSEVSIESIANLIDLANRSLSYGFLNLRKVIIGYILHCPIKGVRQYSGRNPILFTEDPDESFALLSANVRNSHLKKRVYTPIIKVPDAPVQENKCKPTVVVLRGVGTNILYQRDEVQSVCAKPLAVSSLSQSLEHYRYCLWWRSRYSGGGPSDQLVPATVDSQGVGAGLRWTAA